MPRQCGEARPPAVIVGGRGPGTLGMVRSLARADIPVILLDESVLSAATHSVCVQRVVISRLSGVSLVKELLHSPPLSLARQSSS